MTVTAKVKLQSAEGNDAYTRLRFVADYADGRNAEWAFATPSLTLDMNVKPEVADHFEVGGAYTLTFTTSE